MGYAPSATSAFPAPTALFLSDGLTDVEKTATQSYLEIRLEVQKSHIQTYIVHTPLARSNCTQFVCPQIDLTRYICTKLFGVQ